MNKILMDKKVINLVDNVDNLDYHLNENEMLIINIFSNSMSSFDINTIQDNNSYLVINFSGFITEDIDININSEILGNKNKNIINFRAIAESGFANVNAKVHVNENTKDNEVVEDLKGILEDGTINLMPILEIDTSEVNAEHYATIGHFPEDELFYLQTKGISKDECIKILKKSFIQSLFDKEFLKQINGKDTDE